MKLSVTRTLIQPFPTIDDYIRIPPHPNRIENGFRSKGKILKKSEPCNPLVSIITIVLNKEHTLEQTIQSVLNQTYDNIEYIVIDGGSTNGTLNILKRYKDKIAYWISEPDNGISDAFNKGIAISTGEIIGIINADDWYEINTVSTIVNVFQDKDIDIVIGATQYWQGNERDFVYSSNLNALEKEMTVSHPAIFIKREIFNKFGLFNRRLNFAMDYELVLRFKLRNAKFHIIDDILANMRLKGNSDINWNKAYKEVRDIKTSLMNHKFKNTLYYYYTVIRRYTFIILQKCGLSCIAHYYKRHHSVVKKIKLK